METQSYGPLAKRGSRAAEGRVRQWDHPDFSRVGADPASKKWCLRGAAALRGLSPQTRMGGAIRESTSYFAPVQLGKQGHYRNVGGSNLRAYHIVDEGGGPYEDRECFGKWRYTDTLCEP